MTKKAGGFWLLCSIGALVFGSQLFVADDTYTWNLHFLFVIAMLIYIICFVIIGRMLDLGSSGILIDPGRKRMSLSRMQVAGWTVIILASFTTVILGRIWDYQLLSGAKYCLETPNGGLENCPWDVTIPQNVYLLIGISFTSGVGASFLNANRTTTTEDKESQSATEISQLESAALGNYETARRLQNVKTFANVLKREASPDEQDKLTNKGAMVANKDHIDSRFADIFKGEEVGNFKYIDVAKVQNFFFTIIAMVSYIFMFWTEVSPPDLNVFKLDTLPGLSEGLITIIGISHAGYLASKTFTQTTPEAGSGGESKPDEKDGTQSGTDTPVPSVPNPKTNESGLNEKTEYEKPNE